MATILVIDDDELVLEAVRIVLEGDEHTVSTAMDGIEGMRLVNQHPYDLVITDLIMPNKEGMGVLIDIKQSFPSLKVIVISGGGRISPESYLGDAKTLGADGTLAKPFSYRDLIACVDQALN